MLTNYAQAKNIIKSGQDLRITKQKLQGKKQFSCRMISVFSRCVNVLFLQKAINEYIDERVLAIEFSILQYGNMHKVYSYVEVMHQANLKDNVLWARAGSNSKVSLQTATPVKQTQTLNKIKSSSESAHEPLTPPCGHAGAPSAGLSQSVDIGTFVVYANNAPCSMRQKCMSATLNFW